MSFSVNRARFLSATSSRHRWARYGPLALWAALIFLASSGIFSGSNTSAFVRPILHWLFPHASEATLNFIHGVLIRKSAHFTEYAIFALLAAHAFRTSSREWISNHWFLVSVLLVAVYSLSDEFHQSFVSSRTASLYDCLIDSLGGLLALTLVAIRERRRQSAPSRS